MYVSLRVLLALGLGPALSDVADFVDSAWDTSPSLRNGWGVG